MKKFGEETVYCIEESSNKKCLYEALSEIYYELKIDYEKIIEDEVRKYKIDKVEITGIGTCTDNCSGIDKMQAIRDFIKAIDKPCVNTRYCCLYEENVVNAYEIGFRTITIMCEKNF